MSETPAPRRYIESLIDGNRVAAGLVELAREIYPRFAEATSASDTGGPAGSAEHFAGIYEVRYRFARRTGNDYRGFLETLDCLRSEVEPDASLRLLSLHSDNLLFIFLVEVASERLVGAMLSEIKTEISENYRTMIVEELSASAVSANSAEVDFEYLRSWSAWPDEKLRALYCQVTHDWMLRVQQALGSEDERALEVNAESFPALVKALRQRMQDATKELSDAIIRSSELAKVGKPDEGRAVLQAFVDRCPSAFYCEIAVAHSRSL